MSGPAGRAPKMATYAELKARAEAAETKLAMAKKDLAAIRKSGEIEDEMVLNLKAKLAESDELLAAVVRIRDGSGPGFTEAVSKAFEIADRIEARRAKEAKL